MGSRTGINLKFEDRACLPDRQGSKIENRRRDQLLRSSILDPPFSAITRPISASLAVLFLLLFAGVAQAQTASLGGTVIDVTGAVVPGTRLTVTEAGRKLSRTTESDAGGNYLFTALPPGGYELKAEQSDFKTFVRAGITLEVNQSARLDVSLQVGATTDTITIAGQTPLISTQDTTLGGVIENRRIMETPLNGRYFLDLANLLLRGADVELYGADGDERESGQFRRGEADAGAAWGRQFVPTD